MVWLSKIKPWEEYSDKEQEGLRCFWSTKWLENGCTLAEDRLDPLQLANYKLMKEFFARCDNSFKRLWVNERSRRLGKDHETVVFVREEMRKNKNRIYYYGTAFEKDINLILIPILKYIEQDCPPECRLIARTSKGVYVDPETCSELRLVGLDVNPNGIRGNRGDGIVVTEYAYCDHIEESETAFAPMLVENPRAWRIYNSTPSESIAHKWSRVIVPKARLEGGYSIHTLDECPRFSAAQIEAAYEEFGGRDTTKSKREYRCEHVGEQDAMVVPEWPNAKNECLVSEYPRPVSAHCYIGMDPGMVDLTGIVAAYYDFDNDMLVFERAVAKRRLNTEDIAREIEAIENPWKEFRYFDHVGVSHPNPYRRIIDVEPRLIADLNTRYGKQFAATPKRDLHASINVFRARVRNRKIRILPEASELAIHMDGAIWNKQRTQLEHVTSAMGHFDLLMASVYVHRNLDMQTSPHNPNKTIPINHHVVYKPTKQQSGWTHKRDSRGAII